MLQMLPDRLYLKIMFRRKMGYSLNLDNPMTYSEKLQWLKLYYRRPEYSRMVDKQAVKEYVSGIIGEKFVIPTLGVWDRPEDIEWGKLPDRFVLKTTHGGGNSGVVICRNKNDFDKKKAIEKLNNSLNADIFKIWREWPYKNVQHRVIAEQYIESTANPNDLPDYKFFCFNGDVKGLFVATERQNPNEEVKFDFFDADFCHLPFRQGHDHARCTPVKPNNFELMKDIAGKLSKDIPHVRVDLYDLGDKVLFGELTFFHFSGMMPFEPKDWDYKFGEWLKLPSKI